MTGAAAHPLERALELQAEGPRATHERGPVVVQLEIGEALQVDHDVLRARRDTAAHTAAGAERQQGDALGPGVLHERDDLGSGSRPHDRRRQVPRRCVSQADQLSRPKIARVREQVGRVATEGEIRNVLGEAVDRIHGSPCNARLGRRIRGRRVMVRLSIGRQREIPWALWIFGTLAVAAACGGPSSASGGANTPDDDPADLSRDDGDEASSSGDGAETASAPPASCQGEDCFECGAGFCLTGYYCDRTAPGGPACSWLPECPDAPSCDCVRSVLGKGCSCEEAGSGLFVECE